MTFYSGMRQEPTYPPFYGAADPYREGPGSPTIGRENLRDDMSRGPAGFIMLGATPVEGSLPPFAYTAASLVGAAVGGALIGYIASEKREGAIRGSIFAASLAALSDAMLFFTSARPVAAVSIGALGLSGIGWAIWKVKK